MKSKHISSRHYTFWLYHQLELFGFNIQVEITFIGVLCQVAEADILTILVSVDTIMRSIGFESNFAFFD
jgi:hypothetical protein